MTTQDFYVHPSACIDEGAKIGEATKVWHFCHVSSEAVLGKRCILGQNVFVDYGVRVGDRCKIQNNVSIYKGVTLEDEVFCGPSCVFTNVVTPRAGIERKSEFAPTLVKRGATIGANATIVCGTTVGQYALIGAGAVVSRDVPDYALILGVPGRISGWVCSCGEVLCHLNQTGRHTCRRCNATFDVTNDSAAPVDPAGQQPQE
jgi:UDP-2-acetamido-3-amino-2,3-dideoxy-glucuronate N-acetyltransferase